VIILAVKTLESPTDTGLCSVREFGDMFVPPKTKKKEQKSSIEKATQGCVLPHVSRYIIHNCISEE
jgi:hypothetical protein